MKRKILGLLLAACMTLCLVPVTAGAVGFSGWTELTEAHSGQSLTTGKYYLTKDITVSNTIYIGHFDSASVTIDLNGHVLRKSGGGDLINVRAGSKSTGPDGTSYTPGSSLLVQDSAPNTAHTGDYAGLPAGGVLAGSISIMGINQTEESSAKMVMTGGTIVKNGLETIVEVWANASLTLSGSARLVCDRVNLIGGTLYANGGAVDCPLCSMDENLGYIVNTASEQTHFYGNVSNITRIDGGVYHSTIYTSTIDSGLFYGSIQGNCTVGGKTVTFRDGVTTYATRILPAGRRIQAPEAPSKDGYLFTGWFRADGTHYDFTEAVAENMSLEAGWFDLSVTGGTPPQVKIGADNFWYVSNDGGKTWTSLGVKATGADGKDGLNGKDGVDGRDGLNGKDGADGKDGVDGKDGLNGKDGVNGKDGQTPYIGENGNWWIGETDTGVSVTTKGDKGDPGTPGKDGVGIAKTEINENGELIITYTDGATANLGRVLSAAGKDGTNGKNGIGIANAEINDSGELVLLYSDGRKVTLGKVVGADGKDGVGIAKTEINEKGELVLTYTNGRTENLGRVVGRDNSSTLSLIAIAVGGAALLGNIGVVIYLVGRKKHALSV